MESSATSSPYSISPTASPCGAFPACSRNNARCAPSGTEVRGYCPVPYGPQALFLAEPRILGQSLLHLHVNEARHLAVVNAAPPQAVGHVHAVHEHVHIIRLGNDVGNHEPDGKLAAGSVFLENFQIVADDLHAAVHGMPGNAVEPENVTRHRNGLLKEIQQANPVPDSLSHHQAHGARAQIDHRLS